MCFKFKSNLKYIAILLSNLSKKDAICLLLKLKKINELDSNSVLVNEKRENFLKLILSQNNINNPDTHPIGLDLSIELYATAAQNVLNIKQLDTVQKSTNSGANINTLSSTTNTISNHFVSSNMNEDKYYKENFEEFAKHILKLPSNKIMPNINGTILHATTDDKSWVRVRLTEQAYKSTNKCYGKSDSNMVMNRIIEQIYKDHPPLLKLCGVAQFSEYIYEFYYTDKHVVQCLLFYQNQKHVENIIFYSNLRKLKEKSNSKLLTLSSILKFYYCYNYTHLDFSLSTAYDLKNLQRMYLYAILFMYKDNMNTSTGDKLNTPMSCLSGNSPSYNIQCKSRNLEPLTEYEIMLLGPHIMKHINAKKGISKKRLNVELKKKQPSLDLRSTSMSFNSLRYGMKHKTYVVSNDRDSKMFSKQGFIGGHNQHEVILYK